MMDVAHDARIRVDLITAEGQPAYASHGDPSSLSLSSCPAGRALFSCSSLSAGAGGWPLRR